MQEGHGGGGAVGAGGGGTQRLYDLQAAERLSSERCNRLRQTDLSEIQRLV